jgi:prepilin-type N-terminal cleavage/methylation domain-containing protein
MMGTLFNKKGITLIELLVVLVISGVVLAGIYRIFIAQTKAYTVQDQVAEVQQNVRNAMEILVRDLRMAGCDDDRTILTINNPIPLVGNNAITVTYEYFDQSIPGTVLYTVAYNLSGTDLLRQATIGGVVGPSEEILENVDQLNFTYGIDTNNDGYVENWVNAGAVGTSIILAVRVQLMARPTQINPDLNSVSPRRLDSVVSMRNQIIRSLNLI